MKILDGLWIQTHNHPRHKSKTSILLCSIQGIKEDELINFLDIRLVFFNTLSLE